MTGTKGLVLSARGQLSGDWQTLGTAIVWLEPPLDRTTGLSTV
jgi:hypothetical protein